MAEPRDDAAMKDSTLLPVVAAALINAAGEVLVQRRPLGKHHAGLWEFPGGKIEPGESAIEALGRELREELGLELEDTTPAYLGQYSALAANEPGQVVQADVFWVQAAVALAPLSELEEVVWVIQAQAQALPLAALTRDCNLPLASKLTGTLVVEEDTLS